MRKWIEILIHILFWGCTTWLIASGFSIQSHEIELINGIETVKIIRNNRLIYQLLICIFCSMIAFYITTWLIVKSYKLKKRKNQIWYMVLTFTVLIILINILTQTKLFSNSPPVPKQLAYGVAVFYFSISVAYGLVKNTIYYNQRHQQLIIDKKQAELNLLRNQLQTHFLFNALNNLLSMVRQEENPKLAISFDKLSQLLRFVIEENKSGKIPVSKEIIFLKNYIDLQKLRFDEQEVSVQFIVKGNFDEQTIEPGLFIPFVENAFKYGTEPENDTKIEIEFDLSRADSVQFEIKNKKIMFETNGIGTGIENTKRRLELIYPSKHKLIISNADDFIVQLTINTQ